MIVPTLTTDRLVLSAHTREDWADCCALWADPQVTRFIGGQPFQPDEVWARILRYAGLWSVLGYGYWAIRERATGRFLGEAGFADFKRAITPALGDRPEAGWILSPSAHGKGFAREAMDAALRWIEAAGFGQTVCIIAPGNTTSLTLAGRLGYKVQGEALFRDKPTILLAR